MQMQYLIFIAKWRGELIQADGFTEVTAKSLDGSPCIKSFAGKVPEESIDALELAKLQVR